MQVLKIKDCVPIEELIELGFKEVKHIKDKNFINGKWIIEYEADGYWYGFDDDMSFIRFYPETRILYFSTCDQTYIPVPNILCYLIKNSMIELIEAKEV